MRRGTVFITKVLFQGEGTGKKQYLNKRNNARNCHNQARSYHLKSFMYLPVFFFISLPKSRKLTVCSSI
jgi:hypothetical protein